MCADLIGNVCIVLVQSVTPKLLSEHIITEVDLVRSNLLEADSIFDSSFSSYGDTDTVRQLVDSLDTDKDGRVSYPEFVRGFSETLPYDFAEFVSMITEYEVTTACFAADSVLFA